MNYAIAVVLGAIGTVVYLILYRKFIEPRL